MIAAVQRTISRLAPSDRGMARDEEQEGRTTLWAFAWTLFAFKIATVAAIGWAAGWTTEVNTLIAATTWPWLIVPALAISGPLLFHLRLRRVRARRAALQRSEWMID